MKEHYLEIIRNLRSGLSSLFERFREEDLSIGVQNQLDRWIVETRSTLNESFGSNEADIFNSIFLNVYVPPGSNHNKSELILDYIQRASAYLESLESGIGQSSISSSTETPCAAISNQTDPTRVFVVHGRNDKINRAVYSFLRAINLRPYQWEDLTALVGASPYIGDVISAGIKNAQATVVILSPDEIVSLRPELSQPSDSENTVAFQSRPNVFFEAGMALAVNETRTIILEIGEQRCFSDIFGRHLIRLDNTPERRNALVSRLKEAGCAVETKGDHWINEGDFRIDIEATPQTDEMALKQQDALSEQERVIIRCIAEGRQASRSTITAALNESEVKIDYYLRRLQGAGLIGAVISMAGGQTQYVLLDEGTRFAVENLGL